MARTYEVVKDAAVVMDKVEAFVRSFNKFTKPGEEKDYITALLNDVVKSKAQLIARAKEIRPTYNPQWDKGEVEAGARYNPPSNKPKG